MVFNNKGKFFLNLDEKTPVAPAKVAPVVAAAPAATSAPAAPAAKETKSAPAPAQAQAAPVKTDASGKVMTTAEAIAAELAAEEAARPARTNDTFAPECVTAGGALPMRRRRGGANLAGFRSMASGLFGKK